MSQALIKERDTLLTQFQLDEENLFSTLKKLRADFHSKHSQLELDLIKQKHIEFITKESDIPVWTDPWSYKLCTFVSANDDYTNMVVCIEGQPYEVIKVKEYTYMFANCNTRFMDLTTTD